jgi:hypothetical protein
VTGGLGFPLENQHRPRRAAALAAREPIPGRETARAARMAGCLPEPDRPDRPGAVPVLPAGTIGDLTAKKGGVGLESVPLQEVVQLVLKGKAAMVFLLAEDVPLDHRCIRFAHGKGAVTDLPGKGN